MIICQTTPTQFATPPKISTTATYTSTRQDLEALLDKATGKVPTTTAASTSDTHNQMEKSSVTSHANPTTSLTGRQLRIDTNQEPTTSTATEQVSNETLSVLFTPHEAWYPTYVRTRHKNLRCFPCCLQEHKERSFCGLPLRITLRRTPNTNAQHGGSLPVQHEQNVDHILVGAFRRKSDPPLVAIGDSAQNLLATVDGSDNLILAIRKSSPTRRALPHATKGSVIVSDSAYIFQPRRKWQYGNKKTSTTKTEDSESEHLDDKPSVQGASTCEQDSTTGSPRPSTPASIPQQQQNLRSPRSSDDVMQHAFTAYVIHPITKVCVAIQDSPYFGIVSAWKQSASTVLRPYVPQHDHHDAQIYSMPSADGITAATHRMMNQHGAPFDRKRGFSALDGVLGSLPASKVPALEQHMAASRAAAAVAAAGNFNPLLGLGGNPAQQHGFGAHHGLLQQLQLVQSQLANQFNHRDLTTTSSSLNAFNPLLENSQGLTLEEKLRLCNQASGPMQQANQDVLQSLLGNRHQQLQQRSLRTALQELHDSRRVHAPSAVTALPPRHKSINLSPTPVADFRKVVQRADSANSIGLATRPNTASPTAQMPSKSAVANGDQRSGAVTDALFELLVQQQMQTQLQQNQQNNQIGAYVQALLQAGPNSSSSSNDPVTEAILSLARQQQQRQNHPKQDHSRFS